jgi:hypothetical protein
MKTPKKFLGIWRITETELWDEDALDMVVPAHITFEREGGRFEMICVVGEMDCRFAGDRVEYSWVGNDEMDPASGRGWGEITRRGSLEGRIFFHQGDDSAFVAKRTR